MVQRSTHAFFLLSLVPVRIFAPRKDLSPGQAEAIDRVYREYPHLNDDQFVAEHLDEWLK